MRRAFVTGSAGFVGFHLCRRLLADGWQVTGLDGMTDYYDVRLKERRHAMLKQSPHFRAVEGMLEAPGLVAQAVADCTPDAIIHLAAQAGVRFSLQAPRSYVEANLIGTFEVLEAARATPPAHLMVASTSSVYGGNPEMPYHETDRADAPLSFYAATKKATEAMGHSYAHLHNIPTTFFRFFTVYGPWGRPDMALFRFTRAILQGEPIEVHGHGHMQRDFTYIDDLVEGIVRLIDCPPAGTPVSAADSLSPAAPFRTVNIGNGAPSGLMDYIAAVEAAVGRTAEKTMVPMVAGEAVATWADATLIADLVGPLPRTELRDGVRRFVEWYRDYHGI